MAEKQFSSVRDKQGNVFKVKGEKLYRHSIEISIDDYMGGNGFAYATIYTKTPIDFNMTLDSDDQNTEDIKTKLKQMCSENSIGNLALHGVSGYATKNDHDMYPLTNVMIVLNGTYIKFNFNFLVRDYALYEDLETEGNIDMLAVQVSDGNYIRITDMCTEVTV